MEYEFWVFENGFFISHPM